MVMHIYLILLLNKIIVYYNFILANVLAIRLRVKITNVKELLQLDGTVFYSIKIIINII